MKTVTTLLLLFGAFRCRQQHVWNIILRQLWTQVASVHHEYGRLTLATAGLLYFILTRWRAHKSLGRCSAGWETFPRACREASSRRRSDCIWWASLTRRRGPSTPSTHSESPSYQTPAACWDCPVSHRAPATTWNTNMFCVSQCSSNHLKHKHLLCLTVFQQPPETQTCSVSHRAPATTWNTNMLCVSPCSSNHLKHKHVLCLTVLQQPPETQTCSVFHRAPATTWNTNMFCVSLCSSNHLKHKHLLCLTVSPCSNNHLKHKHVLCFTVLQQPPETQTCSVSHRAPATTWHKHVLCLTVLQQPPETQTCSVSHRAPATTWINKQTVMGEVRDLRQKK